MTAGIRGCSTVVPAPTATTVAASFDCCTCTRTLTLRCSAFLGPSWVACCCRATGSTPTRTYELLAAHAAADPALFSGLRVVQLDEWLGLGDQMQPASCAHYIDTHILASTVAAVCGGRARRFAAAG